MVPQLADTGSRWPYDVIGSGFALIGIGCIAYALIRERQVEAALMRGEFVPPDRALPPGVFEVGIGLQAHARNRGHGREALALLTDWLFEQAGAVQVEAPTDPANVPMKRVFDHVGWEVVGPHHEFDREWVMYAITREQWATRHEV